MTRPARRLAALGPCLVATIVGASAPSADAADEGDRAAIESTIGALWSALGRQDEADFRTLVTPDWQLYTARGTAVDTATLLAAHRANLREFRLEASEVEVRIRGDLAWATYRARMSAVRRGEPWSGDFLMTNVFERGDDGRWRCVHAHESRGGD